MFTRKLAAGAATAKSWFLTVDLGAVGVFAAALALAPDDILRPAQAAPLLQTGKSLAVFGRACVGRKGQNLFCGPAHHRCPASNSDRVCSSNPRSPCALTSKQSWYLAECWNLADFLKPNFSGLPGASGVKISQTADNSSNVGSSSMSC